MLTWGLCALDLWSTLVGATLVVIAQLWRIDRLAWMYDELPTTRWSGLDATAPAPCGARTAPRRVGGPDRAGLRQVGEHIDHCAARILDEEATDAPRLVGERVDDAQPAAHGLGGRSHLLVVRRVR